MAQVHLIEAVYVVHGTDAATHDNVQLGVCRLQASIEVEGWPLQHTVLGYIGADDLAQSVRTEAVDERFDSLLRLVHPSVDGYAAIIDIGSEDEAVATILLEPTGKQFGSAHCHATYDEVVCAGVKGVAQGFIVLDSTAPFDIE